MSAAANDQQQRWDKKYADAKPVTSAAACEVLRSNLHLLPAKGTALDLACGLGGNALLLAEQGLTVTACDISPAGLRTLAQTAKSHNLPLTTRQRDIEQDGLGEEQFDVICVSRYLHRPLCPAILAALKPGGLLFYQTFCEEKPATVGPNRPDFVLRTTELLTLFAGLRLRYYQECGPLGNPAAGNRSEALFIGQRQTRKKRV